MYNFIQYIKWLKQGKLKTKKINGSGKSKGENFQIFCEGWQILNTAIEEFLLCNNCTSIILV